MRKIEAELESHDPEMEPVKEVQQTKSAGQAKQFPPVS